MSNILKTMQFWQCMCTPTQLSSYRHVAAGICVAATHIISVNQEVSRLPHAAAPLGGCSVCRLKQWSVDEESLQDSFILEDFH